MKVAAAIGFLFVGLVFAAIGVPVILEAVGLKEWPKGSDIERVLLLPIGLLGLAEVAVGLRALLAPRSARSVLFTASFVHAILFGFLAVFALFDANWLGMMVAGAIALAAAAAARSLSPPPRSGDAPGPGPPAN